MFFERDLKKITNKRIDFKVQELYTLSKTKRSLCHYNDKRYLLANTVEHSLNQFTLAFGHYILLTEVSNTDIKRAPAEDNMLIRPAEKYDLNFIIKTQSIITMSFTELIINHERLIKIKHLSSFEMPPRNSGTK